MLNFSREFEDKLMKRWIWIDFEDESFDMTENEIYKVENMCLNPSKVVPSLIPS